MNVLLIVLLGISACVVVRPTLEDSALHWVSRWSKTLLIVASIVVLLILSITENK